MAGHYWSMDIPRNVASGATGVATGLLGNAVPLVGLTGGVILQLVEKDSPSVKRFEYWTEGVVDGSVALIARALLRGI